MKREDEGILNQLIQAMDANISKLEMAYISKNSSIAIQIKKELINLQNKIIDIVKK